LTILTQFSFALLVWTLHLLKHLNFVDYVLMKTGSAIFMLTLL